MTITAPSTDSSYSKVLNDKLTISLKYLERTDSTQQCILTFTNTSEQDVLVNPLKQQQLLLQNSGRWFGSIFGSTQTIDESMDALTVDSDQSIHLFLGYIQLFGYVVLNYKFSIDTSSLEVNKGNQWWNNTEYLHQYLYKDDPEHEKSEDHWKLDTVGFIEDNYDSKLIIGGKLGGVADLIVKDEKVMTEDGQLLHDLINVFNSLPKPRHPAPVSLHDLTDPIIPLYTTSQSLLFTDLTVLQNSCKSFHLKFPVKENLPPSYNAHLTGPACDQGLVSIRYSLIVSLIEEEMTNKSKSIYFPLEVVPPKRPIGGINRFLQKKYFEDPVELDKEWKVEQVTGDEEPKNVDQDQTTQDEHRQTFLEDLSKLIDSDVYNMPKVSTMERRKSSVNGYHEEDGLEGYILQLPPHLKTQYRLRVNNQELCLIGVPRPYYHPGEDINYIININPNKANTTKVIGLITYLEAHEVYHLHDSGETQVNKYKVTGNVKRNTFAPSIINSALGESSPSLINDYINIPKFVTSQFQSSKFLSLEYHLVFQFNLTEINGSDEISGEATTAGHVPGAEISEGSTPDLRVFNKLGKFKFETMASSYRFTIPVYVLP
ncbi:hypothetical protein Cantr_03770 [Candida viswanathii]|uniref:Rgp1-domain-containing protein n=1 Tax=Candida viswanathii TaxID=5486 RepID=A0A367XNU0_9ASCO|nr:hypothetical protein Cantr_03770 [Candida viswanathii]